ncbi:MAG: alpha-mannosidase, partial [Brevefilum sp.]|nr:alpha-mannosidase [Brevefilum sp.]
KDQYQAADALTSLTFNPISPGDAWGAKWEYGWFRSALTLPEAASGQMIAVMMDVGGEAAVYVDGEYAGAFDKEHKYILITDAGQPGRSYDILLEAYAGHGPQEWRSGPTPPERETVPEPPEQQCAVGQSLFAVWQEVAFQLAIDVETLWEVREAIDQDSLRVMEIDEGLQDFTLIADFEAPHQAMLASLGAARERLKPLLEKTNGDTTPEMIGFGHAHLDVAWLWPLAETERKCVRTFSNQLALMERYPEYKFFQSQPHLYMMVKEKYPDLYQKILSAVARGQWIADGAAWVEPDTNLTGGESLIRQLMYGKRFFKEEFGVDCQLLWLPDVFGYSGALPQIMLSCGVPYFSTQKIFWAYHGGEAFPYNTFLWEGIDGSQVKAHFHNDYNSEVKPSAVIQRWKERVQKDGFSSRLFPFGYGDGGGGPTREHLEYARRLGNLEGVPKFKIDDPMAFFTAQDAAGWPDARYVGELYFQVHRGTYTSQAQTKRLNRQSEYSLREAELWGSAAMAIVGYQFPFEQWEAAWKTVLLNQFHDILPGSSIARVYEEAEAQLAGVIDCADEITRVACASLVEGTEGLTAFNGLSWTRDELLALPQGWEGLQTADGVPLPIQTSGGRCFAEVHLPACGWVSFLPGEGASPENTLKVDLDLLENDLVRVRLNPCGEITSIFDKVNQCELSAGLCNQFRMYQDIPSAFDAWDLDSMYRQTPVELAQDAEIEIIAEGPLFVRLVVKRVLNNSSMTQTITLRRHARRVDFQTVIDWQERHKLLKVNFPVDYFAREALHEIQFGHLPRPTHRSRQFDQDRFEVPQQKWTALVEGQRGCAILNDGKYGVDVLDNSINLTLLKSALAPDMNTDRGRQEFTYALYFWNGPLVGSGLVQQGYDLNIPPRVFSGMGETQSLFEIDQPNIILETVKPAEDGSQKAIVLRLYEAMGAKTRTRLGTSLPIQAAYQTNMLEEVLEPLEISAGELNLAFRPFEIKTLKLMIK